MMLGATLATLLRGLAGGESATKNQEVQHGA
jgi:hypothetical protein